MLQCHAPVSCSGVMLSCSGVMLQCDGLAHAGLQCKVEGMMAVEPSAPVAEVFGGEESGEESELEEEMVSGICRGVSSPITFCHMTVHKSCIHVQVSDSSDSESGEEMEEEDDLQVQVRSHDHYHHW